MLPESMNRGETKGTLEMIREFCSLYTWTRRPTYTPNLMPPFQLTTC